MTTPAYHIPGFDAAGMLHQLLYDPKHPLLFDSGFFVYFFAVFISVYYIFRKHNTARSLVVSIFSLYFFYKASGWFAGLVLFSAVGDYILSNLIYHQKSRAGKTALLVVSIILNLGLLIYFKYTNFFLELYNQYLNAHVNPLNILLPVGISFYTFENLSYTIDVYRGEFVPEKKFVNYLLFLSFFPKLVMGPVVRAKDFIPQLHKPYVVSQEDFARGFYLIVSGMFKKLIISDYLTLNLVNYVFDDPARHTGLECLVGVFAYTIVIYCDFSGYSDVAIGIAKWLGITIPPNFRSPFQSKSITEFWRRWHISLSSWFFDYVYNPLAISLRNWGKLGIALGLMITLFLCGFWHGAGWKFAIYGLLHGAALVYEFYTKKARKKLFKRVPVWLNSFISIALTLSFFAFSLIFFKTANFGEAIVMLKQIFTDFSPQVFGQFFINYQSVIYMMLLGYVLHFLPDSLPERIIPRLQKAPMAVYLVIFFSFLLIYAQYKSAIQVMPIYLQF